MKKIIAIPLLLLSSSAMAGTFVAPPMVHVVPMVHMAPMVHVAPTVHVAPMVHVHPGIHTHLAHQPLPVVAGAATPSARKCDAKSGAKGCAKN